MQLGESTARIKWTQQEIKRFKAALARYGPANNKKLAEEVGTRTKKQVSPESLGPVLRVRGMGRAGVQCQEMWIAMPG